MATKSQSNARAAITQHSSGLRYLELKGSTGAYRVSKHAYVPIARAGNPAGVAALLTKALGGFNVPVVFGLPMRDCMVRVVEYPRMPMEDAKQALQFDFDRHFSWSYSECSVDVCEVESPLTSSPDKMSMLVAACRNEHISNVLRICDSAGIELKAIEPMNVSVLRAVMEHKFNRKDEAWYSVYSDTDGLHFAFIDKDNGLLYRSSPAGVTGVIDNEDEEDVGRVVSEVQRTISFVSNQFKGVNAGLLVLSGAIAGNPDVVNTIRESTGLRTEVSNVYEQCGIGSTDSDAIGAGFEPALGLCMY